MKNRWLVVSLVCGSLLLHACGGGSGPVATRLSVTATPGTATAGTAVTITVSVLDGSGAVFSKYIGTVHFASSDTQAVLPSDSPLTNGTGTFSVTLKTAGSQTITVASGTLTGTSSPVAVSAGAATQLSITAASGTPAGTAFNITVNALDPLNNVATSYSGTVHFTSTDSQAKLPANSTLTNGTGTFSVTLKTVGGGTQTITAVDTVTPSIAGASNPIAVSPGLATSLSVQAGAAETTGISFSVTVSAMDTYGNLVTSYTGAAHFMSSDAQATLPANATLPGGTATFSVTLKTLGMQTITASDTVTASLKGTSSAINVVSNAATHISVEGPGNVATRQTFHLTVSALDAANNTSVGYSGNVHFTSTDAQAKLAADSTLTAGTADFSATLETVGSGTQAITATDKTTSSITGSLSIGVAAPAALAITSSAPPSGTVGSTYNPHTIRVCHMVFFPFPRNVCTFVHVDGFPLAASGGVSPYSWSWAAAAGSSLPPGLSVANPQSTHCPLINAFVRPGCIYGIPTQPGTFNVVLTVTDSGLPAVQTSANYTITINLPPPPVVNMTTPAPGVLNQHYSYTFTASGYAPLTWSESGAPPAGLTFDDSTGTLSGTPTQTGSFPITVMATDQFKQSSAGAAFTIVVTLHGFVATGSMATARRFHTATLLGNGKVLVAGGEDAGATAFSTAELYDPSSGTFTPTTGNMTAARAGHTAALLGSGKVLITGGATDSTENALSSAELYDPATDTFTATTGSMTTARVSHTATLLKDGRVLIVGGDIIFFNGVQNTSIQSLASAEIFDPSTGTFTATGSLSAAREAHTATLLNDGRVLVAGGSNGAVGNTTPVATAYATAELFDPTTGHFTAAGMMTAERVFFTASLLGSGKVLAAGGAGSTASLTSADLFDPTSTSFAATTGNLTVQRYYHDASTLNDGTILLSGGSDPNNRALATAEIYDPTVGTFATTGSMTSPRVWHTSTLLPSGKVLVTGGAGNDSSPVATAEVYQ
jgi:hypothetical protein